MFFNKLKIYQLLILLPSIILFLFLFLLLQTVFKKYKKIISLRVNSKYFGHLAVEPAILSSYCERNNKILPIVSFRKEKGINNKRLESIIRKSFDIKNDFINVILENIYNYSFEKIRIKIDNLYSPLLHSKLETREISYFHLLDTEKNFLWRKNAQNLIFNKNNNDFKIIIALRTNHYNKQIKNVASEPWRDVSAEDTAYVSKVVSKVIDPKKIFLYYHPKNKLLKEIEELKNSNINFVDQTKVDILSLFSTNSILINNGNGIGAAAISMGIKTLYIHHTLWHFWHTSHANALCLPSLFLKSSTSNEDLENLISLAFSPKNDVPFDFAKEYYPFGITINKIKDIKEKVLIKTIREIISNKEDIKRKKQNFMGCQFEYGSIKERKFWEIYISKLPSKLRKSHRLIKLKISDSFLDSF